MDDPLIFTSNEFWFLTLVECIICEDSIEWTLKENYNCVVGVTSTCVYVSTYMYAQMFTHISEAKWAAVWNTVTFHFKKQNLE